MALPELVSRHVEKTLAAFCDRRVPAHVRDKVRLIHATRGNSVTLIETRPRWNDAKAAWTESPVARFDYDPKSGAWSLKCRDRNQKWHDYDLVAGTKRFEDLLAEVDKDPTGIFWG